MYPNTIDNTTALWDLLQQNYHNFNVSLFANDTAMAQLEVLYPEDPALGSPYGTGNETFFGAQFKRAASLYGGKTGSCDACLGNLTVGRCAFPSAAQEVYRGGDSQRDPSLVVYLVPAASWRGGMGGWYVHHPALYIQLTHSSIPYFGDPVRLPH